MKQSGRRLDILFAQGRIIMAQDVVERKPINGGSKRVKTNSYRTGPLVATKHASLDTTLSSRSLQLSSCWKITR